MNAPAGPSDHATALAALRGQGAGRLDPVRFRFIEALARRAEAHTGAARHLLDARLAEALREYGERFARTRDVDANAGAPTGAEVHVETAADAASTRAATGAARTPLAELAAYLAQRSAGELACMPANGPVPAATTTPAPAGELKSVRYFRDTWAKLSIDQQLADAFAQLPTNAGPLNSQLLVLRALERMRDLSPDYLNRFMCYADTLLWLDQANSAGAPAEKKPAAGEGDKKRKGDRGGTRKDAGDSPAKRRGPAEAS